MPSFFGVNKPEVPKLFSEDVLLIFFVFQIIRGSWDSDRIYILHYRLP